MPNSPLQRRPSNTPHRQYHVVGLGQCSLDYLCTITQYPTPNSKCEFQDFTIQGGGPVATALVLLSRWGIATRFIGLLSNDTFGKAILKGLGNEGVDCSGTIVRRGGRSQFAFICIEKKTGNRSIFWSRPDCEPIRPEEVPLKCIASADVLHLDGLFVEASVHAAHYAKSKKVPVVLDAGSLRPGILDVVRYTDHLIAAEHFVKEYARGESYESALYRLRKLGPKVVVVTLGERGSISVWHKEVLYFPPHSVTAVDTTGAGDIFHGAYIFGLLKKWSPMKCIRLATTTAAISCLAIGGRAGIPSLEKALEQLKVLASPTASTTLENLERPDKRR